MGGEEGEDVAEGKRRRGRREAGQREDKGREWLRNRGRSEAKKE